MKFSQVERWLASMVRPCALYEFGSPRVAERWRARLMPENVSEIVGAVSSGSDDVPFREAGILVVTFAHQRDASSRRQSGGDRRAFSGVRG